MLYIIEQKIETLAENAVMAEEKPASFTKNDILFSHWEFDYGNGWSKDSWIARSEIEAKDFAECFNIFNTKLKKIIPKIALISQCYTEFFTQPFIIIRPDLKTAFFRYTKNEKGVGLMFMESELKALDVLLAKDIIPEEFYNYWNDAVNTTGYSSKLLLMFSAIEALVKLSNGKKDWGKIELILGKELSEVIFGTKENSSLGLRNRLVYGEYLNPNDSKIDYLEAIHNRIINYFNEFIFLEKLLNDNVTAPQRNFVGNAQEGKFFIHPKNDTDHLDLKQALSDFNSKNFSKYNFLSDSSMRSSF